MKETLPLKKRADYVAVYEQGRSWANNLIVVKVLPNEFGLSRCGFSVGTRVGKAVARNRVRRLLREIVRLTPIKPGWDIVIIARPEAATADYYQLKSSVGKLLMRARLLRNNGEVVSTGVN